MKSGTDLAGVRRINPIDFGDPLTFLPVPPASQTFHLSCEILHTLINELEQNSVPGLHFLIILNLGTLLTDC